MGEVLVGRWQDTLPGRYDPATAIVVTDPPYGLTAGAGSGIRAPGSHMGMGRSGGRTRADVDKGYDDSIPWSQHVAEVLDLLPATRHVIRGPATAIIRRDYPAPRRLCVEASAYRRRATWRPGVVPYMWQAWVVYGRILVGRHASAPAGDALLLPASAVDPNIPRGGRTAHRALTPPASARWVIDTWADPGMTIIDPFAGLGTIGLVAAQLGFAYIGAELVPDYARRASQLLEVDRPDMGL